MKQKNYNHVNRGQYCFIQDDLSKKMTRQLFWRLIPKRFRISWKTDNSCERIYVLLECSLFKELNR